MRRIRECDLYTSIYDIKTPFITPIHYRKDTIIETYYQFNLHISDDEAGRVAIMNLQIIIIIIFYIAPYST